MKVELNEMNKLVHLLADAKIDFEIQPRYDIPISSGCEIIPTFAIITRNNHGCMIVDAVCHPFSYGWHYHDKDHYVNLIEVMAHDEYAGVTNNDVIGYCTAEEAFDIFRKVWYMGTGN